MHPPLPADPEDFRAELRAWLEEHLEDRFRGAGSPIAADVALLRDWNRILADAGYAAIAWPSELGGRDAGLAHQVVLTEEMHRAGAPPTLNPIGIANIAPAIMAHGTSEQKDRFLAPMLRGDTIWCQGFSEPDAGSDLASLRTRAVREGDTFVVNGQKVWTTLGDVADWVQLLVRTDPGAPRHHGISCLLVDMKLPGVEVRPIVSITGEREFHEIFLRDVKVPASALLGEENGGWAVAMTTLASERAGVATLHLRLRSRIEQLVQDVRARDDDRTPQSDPRVRERLARLALRGDLLELLSKRALEGMVSGRPGPEGSLTKLVWSEAEQAVAEAAGELLGLDALGGAWGRERVYARALTIAGGTSEINKNIIAQRVLGLPREPRA